MPGVPESFNDNGTMTAAALTAYGNLAAALQGPISTAGPARVWLPALTKRDTLVPATGLWSISVALLSEIALRVDFGSQDRRKIGRGT